MGYHVIDPDDIESTGDRPCEMHYISEAAGMEKMGSDSTGSNPAKRFR